METKTRRTATIHPNEHELDCYNSSPQWGAVDAEIKVPSVENTELKGSPFKA